ncbi:T-lymphocyte activation antigen CD80 [Rhynchocyon petersi]
MANRKRTFISIKLDGMLGLVGNIIKGFEQKGFHSVAVKVLQASEEHLKQHYINLKTTPSCNRQVTRSVKEVAALSCDYNIPTNHLTNFRLYWQKGNEVVLTVISGQVSVWPDYLNRTILDMTNNLSIFILALRPSDTGTYTCIVQKYENGFYKRVHLALVDLSVQDFHDPIITDVGNTNTGIRKLNCSASGGFPEPHLSWLENGEKLTAIKPRVFQDPETELYTISSELHFNVTSNRTFVCLIQYGYKQVSKTFHWITSK